MKKHVDSEKLVERALREATEQEGGLCIKLLSDLFIGLPDRLVILPGGIIFFVELKTTGQKPRKIQIVVHNKLKALGCEVYVIDTIEDSKNLIKQKVDGQK